jgi:membrane dipeptidase
MACARVAVESETIGTACTLIPAPDLTAGDKMELDWDSLFEDAARPEDGTAVALCGFMVFPTPAAGGAAAHGSATDPAAPGVAQALPTRPAPHGAREGMPPAADTFVLVRESACCAGHLPCHPDAAIEVYADLPVDWHGGPVRVTGTWQTLQPNAAGWHYRIANARARPVVDPAVAGALGRRSFLRVGALGALGGWTSLMGLAACGAPRAATYSGDTKKENSPGTDGAAVDARALPWLRDGATVDMHSHAGRMTLGRETTPRPFTAVAAPMRAGGMNVACLAIVTDSSADHIVESASGRRRIVAYREPAPGEMSSRGVSSFERLHELIAQQNLLVVTDAASLQATRTGAPGVIVAAEGADFLEGDAARLDQAYSRYALRHLQLTHYRVNELGDIQTAPPVHLGLTPFGAEVIRRCNQLGVVVDVAHGTYDLVKRAAEVSTRPLVLSHTALVAKPGRYSRAISPDHARVIAATGGVIGVWPVSTTYPDLAAMAQGMKRLADLVGVAHVGLGTDMLGLLAPSVLGSYRKLPLLAQALVDTGFTQEEARQILGGNYARVFAATMAA